MSIDISRTIDEINTLPVEDRLLIIEKVWDSLPKQEGTFPMSDEQLAELNRRIDEYETNPNDGLTWDEVLERLKGTV